MTTRLSALHLSVRTQAPLVMAHAKAPSLQESQKEVSLSVAEAMVLLYRNGIRGYFADPGRRLDFFLVCLSIADVWILAQIDLKADMNGFMAIRCLRLMRVIRLVRVFSVKKELNVFICSVIGALRAMSWMIVLLFL